jgi:hypothetical protein
VSKRSLSHPGVSLHLDLIGADLFNLQLGSVSLRGHGQLTLVLQRGQL